MIFRTCYRQALSAQRQKAEELRKKVFLTEDSDKLPSDSEDDTKDG